MAKDVLTEEQYSTFVELARTVVQGCTEQEEFACIEKVENLFEGHGLLKHHFNLILPGSFDIPQSKRTELHGVEDYFHKRREGTLPNGVVSQPEASRQLGGLFAAAADLLDDDEAPSWRDDFADVTRTTSPSTRTRRRQKRRTTTRP